MSNSHFAKMPNISIPRTKMKQDFTHSTSFNFGKLVPIDAFLVAPGDSYNLKMSSLIRMTQPIVPLMDTIECDVHAFFVPMRLIYKNTEEFFGANKTSAGYQKQDFQIPQGLYDPSTILNYAGTVPGYLGFPQDKAATGYNASILKLRAYYLIWSEWYRAQQIQDPFVMLDSDDDASGNSCVGHIGVKDLYPNDTSSSAGCILMNVCKKMDYFTAATISPQYGDEVLLPLGDFAPVITRDENHDVIVHTGEGAGVHTNLPSMKLAAVGEAFGTDIDEQSYPMYYNGVVADTPGEVVVNADGVEASGEYIGGVAPVNLYADLSTATAASVNQVRYAFQVQKYLERANFGSRYFEVLAAHYGVTSPDARLQRPEYLGGQHFLINIQQVLSTAGATTGEDTKLGQPGANSTTAKSGHLFSKAFVEWGYVIVMLSTRQGSHKYSQGLAREDSYKTKFEFYSPEFANLGDQAILNKEIFIEGTENDDEVFGYQEHWAEMRYRPDRVSGMLNPNVVNSEDYWTLANKFSNCPTLSPQFVEENRDNLKRALINGDNADTINDFIADFYFDYTAVRELPAYTIPGLIDHFGSR